MNPWVFTIISCIFIIFCMYKVLKIISSSVYRQEKGYLTKKSSRSAIFFDSNVSSWETRRDMGNYESYLTDLDSRFHKKLYSVIFLKSRVTLRRETIQNALVLLSRKHPLLRAKVDLPERGYSFYENFDDSDAIKKQFVILEEGKFRPELRFVNTSHWRIVLEEELLVNKAHRQLWTTILLRDQYHASERLYTNTILFFFDQLIMDRKSIFQFIEDFVSFLCKLLNCDIHIADTRTQKLQAPVEELLKGPMFLKSLSFMTKGKLQSVSNFISSLDIFQQNSQDTKVQTRPLFLQKTLSTEETFQLLNMCEKMDCSLTSVFITAWLVAQTSNSNGFFKRASTKQDVTVIVDCRGYLETPVPSSYLGNYSSLVTLHLTSGCKANLWRYAEHCERLVRIAIKNEDHLDFIWKMKHCNPSSSFEITDVGRFHLMKLDPVMVDDIYVAGNGGSKESLTLAVINNKLYCGLHCGSCLNESECSRSFNSMFVVLQNMCS